MERNIFEMFLFPSFNNFCDSADLWFNSQFHNLYRYFILLYNEGALNLCLFEEGITILVWLLTRSVSVSSLDRLMGIRVKPRGRFSVIAEKHTHINHTAHIFVIVMSVYPSRHLSCQTISSSDPENAADEKHAYYGR